MAKTWQFYNLEVLDPTNFLPLTPLISYNLIPERKNIWMSRDCTRVSYHHRPILYPLSHGLSGLYEAKINMAAAFVEWADIPGAKADKEVSDSATTTR